MKRKEVLNSMNKYNAKEQKKQDLLTKATKKKHRNQILTYLIKNLVSVATWENIRDCNTFMMLVSDQTMEKKKQHKGNSCKNRSEEHTSELQSRGHLVCRLLL